MNDPRIEEVLKHMGETDEQGNPTELARAAERVREHSSAVDQLRSELAEVEGGLAEAESRVRLLSDSLQQRAVRRSDLQYEAQDAAVRAALSGSSAGSANLRHQATNKRQNIVEFEKDIAEDQKRLDQANESLRSRQARVRHIRDQIARRMNTIETVVAHTDVASPSASLSRRPASRPAVRRTPRPVARGSTRRIVVRRRRAN